MITMLTLVSSVVTVACIDELFAPKRPVPEQEQQVPAPPPPQGVRGEATLAIRLDSTGAPLVTLTVNDSSQGIVPVLAAEPSFDPASRILTVAVAVRNRGPLRLREPAAVAIPGGPEVLRDRRAGGQASLALAEAPDLATAPPGLAVGRAWQLASLTAARADTVWSGRRGLRPGARSEARAVQFVIPPQVSASSAFAIPLVAAATLRLEIPAEAPPRSADSVLLQAREPQRIVRDSSLGRIVRNRFWLSFDRGVPHERRQAVIDAIDGIVVGGMDFGPTGYYYIELPPETMLEQLRAAIRTVATMPGVRATLPDMLDSHTRPAYRKPIDDGAYSGWTIEPAQAAIAVAKSRPSSAGFRARAHRPEPLLAQFRARCLA